MGSQLSSPPGTGSAHCLQHEYSSQTLSSHSAEDVQEEWRGEEAEEDQQAGGSQRQAAREAGGGEIDQQIVQPHLGTGAVPVQERGGGQTSPQSRPGSVGEIGKCEESIVFCEERQREVGIAFQSRYKEHEQAAETFSGGACCPPSTLQSTLLNSHKYIKIMTTSPTVRAPNIFSHRTASCGFEISELYII